MCTFSNHQRIGSVQEVTPRYMIAVLPGDGIGKEVMPEGVRLPEQAARRFDFELEEQWRDHARGFSQSMRYSLERSVGRPSCTTISRSGIRCSNSGASSRRSVGPLFTVPTVTSS
jgi:hypothetical protein